MNHLKTVFAIAVTALLAFTATYFALKPNTDRLHADLQNALAAQDRLAKEREELVSDLKRREAELEQGRKDKTELLRLRGEVGQLRTQLGSVPPKAAVKPTTVTETKTKGHPPGSYIPKTELSHVGFATPEAALETMAWATLVGTYQQTKEGLAPALLAGVKNEDEESQQHEQQKLALGSLFKGVQVLAKKTLSEDRVELKMKTDFDPAIKDLAPHIKEFMIQNMVKIGDSWKIESDPREHQAGWDSEGQVLNY
ncbi:MAG: polymerase, sigma-24 subunit, subfamily [Verrucomicrobiales bacterium]|jgi:hypothetical protein|nr:polymerase, sigma-24 subunit, subfamily [Verrucomicrobiales bacterium]